MQINPEGLHTSAKKLKEGSQLLIEAMDLLKLGLMEHEQSIGVPEAAVARESLQSMIKKASSDVKELSDLSEKVAPQLTEIAEEATWLANASAKAATTAEANEQRIQRGFQDPL